MPAVIWSVEAVWGVCNVQAIFLVGFLAYFDFVQIAQKLLNFIISMKFPNIIFFHPKIFEFHWNDLFCGMRSRALDTYKS